MVTLIKKARDVIAVKVTFYSIISRIGRWREITYKKGHKITFQGTGSVLLLLPLTSTFMFYKLLYMLHNKS